MYEVKLKNETVEKCFPLITLIFAGPNQTLCVNLSYLQEKNIYYI